jgi:hypothetical protein
VVGPSAATCLATTARPRAVATIPDARWRRIGETWLEALAATPPGAQTIGETGLPADMTDLFRSRAELLLDWVVDPDAWPPDRPRQ